MSLPVYVRACCIVGMYLCVRACVCTEMCAWHSRRVYVGSLKPTAMDDRTKGHSYLSPDASNSFKGGLSHSTAVSLTGLDHVHGS